jgi:hypothetical protein
MSRPEYWLNPTGRTMTALWNGGKKLITNFADRFTEKGFRLGSNYISVGVPKNTIYSGVPLLEVKVNPIHTKGADLDQLLKIEQAGYNAATITPTEAFNKLSRQE